MENKKIMRRELEIVQINLGNRCNQRCFHCHIEGSPEGRKNMDSKTALKIRQKLAGLDIKNVEFTGGAPELNPNLKYFIEELSGEGKNLTVRTNLTVLNLPEYSFYIDLYRKHKITVTASLPSYNEEDADGQRGKGVFRESLQVLRILNKYGYGNNGLYLNLVYNPDDGVLPPNQSGLEREYKQILKEKHGIVFNNLITIVNSPIKRFRSFLQKEGKLETYIGLLREKYNSETLDNVMCRKLISVDYEGFVYDCDFNLALKRRIKGYENKRFWEIDFSRFNPEVVWNEHCYACTAGSGSSCHGTLVKDNNNIKESVKKYYGEELHKTEDLKTNACCSAETPPEHIREALALIDDEIKTKYYGCGSPIPLCLEDLKTLDVGCGTGRDVYILSKLVGKKGFCYGIDMTENQVEVARRYIREQTKKFGYKKPNVEFVLDYIENIEKHFSPNSLDLIISNCVINLMEDKENVLRQIYKVLRWGGEFYFSDVYADRRAPEKVRKNPVLYNECLGGALYCRDFERAAKKAGFTDPRIMSQSEITINNPKIEKLVGNLRFFSTTYRLWKLKGLEEFCEDYGHIAIYKGGVSQTPFKFELDSSHTFYKDKPERVCGNTARMLSETRFEKYFKIIGSFKQHFGEFKDCGNTDTSDNSKENGPSGGCGC